MIYAGILAGGYGWQQKKDEMPNQYMILGKKPIIIHSLEQFIVNSQIDKIIIAAPRDWIIYTKDLIKRYYPENEQIYVVEGGENKGQTIIKIAEYIVQNWGVSNKDICINHDAIRPFVTQRIIDENIEEAKNNNAVTTIMPIVDSIVVSLDGYNVEEIPDRKYLYDEQTPQTFKIAELIRLYNSLEIHKRQEIFNATKIFIDNSEKLKVVRGEYSNIKIVTQYDIEVANALLREKKYDK